MAGAVWSLRAVLYPFPSLVLGVELLHSRILHSLGILLDSQLLLKSRWYLWPGGPLHRYILRASCTLHSSAGQCTGYLTTGLLQSSQMGMFLKTTHKLQLVQNTQTVMDISHYGHVSPLLHRLHWLPVDFWMQLTQLTLFPGLELMSCSGGGSCCAWVQWLFLIWAIFFHLCF